LRGVYCLIVSVLCDINLRVGALGVRKFPAGKYIYVGSALNGLEARIGRHLRTDSQGVRSRPHWHIDYLLLSKDTRIEEVWVKECEEKEECWVAEEVSRHGDPIKGFGCSDCNCVSHLFRVEDIDFLRKLGLRPWRKIYDSGLTP